ncbi:MAG TPA: AmmeMemoRadiSam system protein B [Longimicrobiales bacterium]|nr:AmmeMemoRadiSam system protein B [Longimicrobiales bacterium]
MSNIREPAVAGMFYPGSADALRAAVRGFLAGARGQGPGVPRALIAPHAGYIYSGAVAGSAYALLPEVAGSVQRVLLLGPAHHVPVRGLAVPAADGLATPLGVVAVDRDGVARALELPGVVVSDEAHAPEHSLEVQLPFLQETLGAVPVVPLLVGVASDGDVADVLDALWSDGTFVVVSSDLSHYHDYDTAVRRDAATAAAIEALQPLGPRDACGRLPINSLLRVAERRGLRAHTLDLRNSGDTAGPKDRVVGYGAFAFTNGEGD